MGFQYILKKQKKENKIDSGPQSQQKPHFVVITALIHLVKLGFKRKNTKPISHRSGGSIQNTENSTVKIMEPEGLLMKMLVYHVDISILNSTRGHLFEAVLLIIRGNGLIV